MEKNKKMYWKKSNQSFVLVSSEFFYMLLYCGTDEHRIMAGR